MKITIIVLIAGLCLVAVSGGTFKESEEVDFEFELDDSTDDIVDIETFGFLSVVKAALRTVKGMNCSIKAALIMKAAAEQGLRDLQECGDQVSKRVKSVIKLLKNIVSICNDIIKLNQNVCKTDDDDTSTSKSCFPKIVKKFYSLYKNIQKCIRLIKKIPTAGSQANDCVITAVKKVSDTFVQFPSYISNCSKLTSN